MLTNKNNSFQTDHEKLILNMRILHKDPQGLILEMTLKHPIWNSSSSLQFMNEKLFKKKTLKIIFENDKDRSTCFRFINYYRLTGGFK